LVEIRIRLEASHPQHPLAGCTRITTKNSIEFSLRVFAFSSFFSCCLTSIFVIMDKKDHLASSDDENFEDANEKIVNNLIKETAGIKISEDDEVSEKDDSEPEENDKENFVDCESSDFIDDESQKDAEKDQTEEERETAKNKAEELKKEGNELFKAGDYLKSAEVYTEALRTCPVVCATERSVLYGNRAAAKQKMNLKAPAIDDCGKSIEFNPSYVKVLLR
jgi:tetratricopeptide (TPR) repeat protein